MPELIHDRRLGISAVLLFSRLVTAFAGNTMAVLEDDDSRSVFPKQV